jgi:hypothetical protein
MDSPLSAGERHWPDDLRYLWDRSLSAQELGGLIATRGFYYQYLYALRLMAQIWRQECAGYTCEVPEDFTAWESDASGRTTRLEFIQLKTSVEACFLCGASKKQEKVFEAFKRAARRLDRCEVSPGLSSGWFVMSIPPVTTAAWVFSNARSGG